MLCLYVTFQRRREECERKARRGEMDPRLEYAFQLLIDATGLSRHEVMDYVFEADMVREQKKNTWVFFSQYLYLRSSTYLAR